MMQKISVESLGSAIGADFGRLMVVNYHRIAVLEQKLQQMETELQQTSAEMNRLKEENEMLRNHISYLEENEKAPDLSG